VRQAIIDGARSRAPGAEGTGARCDQSLLDYGYKELDIPAGPGGAFRLEKHALHIWPRGTFMLIALPNFDGSFTCTLFLPFEGPDSFATLTAPAEVRAFFRRNFPDVLAVLPDLEAQFARNPVGQMVTVKAWPWCHGSRALLMGDAAHAIVPFFGQGMNAGFEDCTVFQALLDQGLEGEELFRRFAEARQPDTDAIADLAVENFVEMRDKVAQPAFLLEKEVEKRLAREFPGDYVPRYSLVTFSRAPYRKARELGRIQSGLLEELCRGLRRADEVDLARAGRLIREKLSGAMRALKEE
jgi:kynurenine 3-monooxygenase